MTTIDQVEKVARHHLSNIVELAHTGQLAWSSQQTPKPDAMRAFSARTDQYSIMVTQANVVDVSRIGNRVLCEGMVIVNQSMMLIRMPPPLADELYHQAAAQRN